MSGFENFNRHPFHGAPHCCAKQIQDNDHYWDQIFFRYHRGEKYKDRKKLKYNVKDRDDDTTLEFIKHIKIKKNRFYKKDL